MIEESVTTKVEFAEAVQTEVSGKTVTVKAEKGEVSKKFDIDGISLKKDNGRIEVTAKPNTRQMRAMMKTVVGHLKNMQAGVTQGYKYKLAIVFSHFPMNVSIKEDKVEITNFAGEKSPRHSKILPGVKVEVKGKDVFVSGVDREKVGQTAANLETATKLKGKDRRIFQDGIYIVEKNLEEVKHE